MPIARGGNITAALAALLVISSGLLPHASAQEYEGRTLVKATLLADTAAVAAGLPFEVGLLLEMAEGWHTYWEQPGDAGLPTSITWDLPPGFSAGPLRWPLPRRIIEPGDIHAFGYKGRVMLMTTIIPPAELASSDVFIRAKATWLVCEAICIPGSASLDLRLPVGTPSPDNQPVFSEFQVRMPDRTPLPYELGWSDSDGKIKIRIPDLRAGSKVDLFPLTEGEAEAGHPALDPADNSVGISAKPPFKALLTVESSGETRGWNIESPAGPSLSAPAPEARSPAGTPSLFMALLYGFVGGLILNLMPCVLPVISLKIFGFIRQAGDAPGKILRHGLAFAGGIFAWFGGLALLIIILKSLGGQVTWAFQFQNPWFNLGISTVVFVFALNLFGVFEIVLPGKATGALDEAGSAHGYWGSFFQGAFATLLATPCTAPFLGTALGFAFSQPAPVIAGMFASVATGMAFPYVLLSARPGWMKILPKPGAWMERLKQFMGFPLLATLIWLLWILHGQKGPDGVLWAACFLLCLAIAVWIYGAFCGPATKPQTRTVALLAALLIALGGTYVFAVQKFAVAAPSSKVNQNGEGIPWVEFSQKSLDELLADGRAVFLDFTADWCISCKFNEKTAIDRPAVHAALERWQIVPMKADWTNANPEITAALAKFGRVGVPFYILYPPGRPDQPIILPEILTEQIVLDAIAKAIGE